MAMGEHGLPGSAAVFAAALLALSGLQAGAAEPLSRGGITTFYPVATAEAQTRHAMADYRLACTREARPESGGSYYISLVSNRSGRIALVAISPIPPSDAASLFNLRSPGATRDWAYVWDRNGDGRIDYLAYYLGTEMVVTNGPLPKGFPAGTNVRLNGTQLEYVIRHMRMTFYHAADDNYDGRVDAVVFPNRDASTPLWVKGFFVLRSTHFDGRVDREWAFASDITKPMGPAPLNAHGYRVRINPDEGGSGEEVLKHWSERLQQFNGVVRACDAGSRLRR